MGQAIDGLFSPFTHFRLFLFICACFPLYNVLFLISHVSGFNVTSTSNVHTRLYHQPAHAGRKHSRPLSCRGLAPLATKSRRPRSTGCSHKQ